MTTWQNMVRNKNQKSVPEGSEPVTWVLANSRPRAWAQTFPLLKPEQLTHDLDILTWGTLVVSVFLIRCTSLTLRFDLQVNLLNALLLCPSWSSWMLPFRRRTDDGFFSNSPLTAPLVKVKDSRVHVSFDNEVVLPTIEAKDLLWNFNDDDKIVEPCYTFLLTSRCRVTPMKLDRLLWITITNGLNCHLNCRRFFCFASG